MGTEGPGWAYRVKVKIKKVLGMNIILCDGCMWNWRGACNRPERPNAIWCPDYCKKGK